MSARKMALIVAALAGMVQVASPVRMSVVRAGEAPAKDADVVPVGAGGYRRTRPQPCKPLPEVVHKTENFKQPVITGQWWSSLLWQHKAFSEPLFAHPLAAVCTEGGMALSYPGAHIHGGEAGIFGGSVGKEGDLKLGHSAAATFRRADCDGYSDWFVTAMFAAGKASMRVSLGHGSPFVYCLYRGGDPTVSFVARPQIWSGGQHDPVLGVTAGGHHYGLFGANGSTWSGIGSKPSYGSDNPLNDHHFHYGYFIRAAAEVARVDPAWAKKWGPMVELLVRDVASSDRRDPMFAYLSCFDKYAGHSWASGDAAFGDGNNQESSSESMNAWYGMILWGQATGNATIRDTGLFLFNTERTAVEEYWFDVSGTNYPADFPHVALGMVWGGKGAFATWFSGDIDCIHGINWLPFTPASFYMGRWPEYVKKNHDRIVARRKGGRDYNNGWGDLVVMFYALSDPAAAAQYIDANPDCKLEGGNSHAFMYHWIHTLNNLGINDAGVTADYPIHGVFNKAGAKTYAVYNYQATPRTVTFSDGTKVVAGAKTLTLKRGR